MGLRWAKSGSGIRGSEEGSAGGGALRVSDETDALCVSLGGSGGAGAGRSGREEEDGGLGATQRGQRGQGGKDPADLRPVTSLDSRDQCAGSRIPTPGCGKRTCMDGEVRALQQVHKVPGLLSDSCLLCDPLIWSGLASSCKTLGSVLTPALPVAGPRAAPSAS